MTTKNKKSTKKKVASKKAPKTAGHPMKGRDILVKALENEGVTVIFGYPGGASMEIHQGLTLSKKIRMVLPRHEQGGSFAASGYARATGDVGVCLATSGPGATNLITGIIDAKMDSIPMVAITGQVPSTVLGSDAFQETDIMGSTFPLVKHSYMVQNIADIPRIINEAFHIAKTGRPGPVLVDIPKDIQQQESVVNFNVKFDCPSYKPNLSPSVFQCKKAAHAIQTAKRPLIYAGGGIIASDASKELAAFVKKTGIPIATTVMGLGAFPSNDPLSLRMLGMHGAVYANIAINHADLVIAMGVRFDDRVTGKLTEFCKDAQFIQIDIDPTEINKNKLIDIPIQGDIKQALKTLDKYVKPLKDIQPWLKQIDAWKKEFPLSFENKKGQIVPQSVVHDINKISNKDAIFSVGVGQHQMWAAQFLDFDEPNNWLCSSGLGAMGYGLPAAMGAQVAFPKRQVINIEGDGSFLMNIQELQTLKIENIPEVFRLLEEVGLTSSQTGMDNVRNIMGCPVAGLSPKEKVDAHSQLKALNEHIIGNPEFTNLPRKFNITLSGCPDDCVHAETQDLALVPAVEEKGGNMVYGFNVLVGGKLGSGGYRIATPLNVFLWRSICLGRGISFG